MAVRKRSNNSLVGYLHCYKVGSTYYDWFARKDGKTMPVPLDMADYTLTVKSSDQDWWENNPNHTTWTVSQWETEFADFLDTELGSNNWHKEARFDATETTW